VFKQRYSLRAGVESELSQGTRVFGLRYARYMGLAKTRLQHIVTAAAMNLSRMWAIGRNSPIGLTRVSSFSALFTSGSSEFFCPDYGLFGLTLFLFANSLFQSPISLFAS
jgi:transposase